MSTPTPDGPMHLSDSAAAPVPVQGDRRNSVRHDRDADAGTEAMRGGQGGILADERHGPPVCARQGPTGDSRSSSAVSGSKSATFGRAGVEMSVCRGLMLPRPRRPAG